MVTLKDEEAKAKAQFAKIIAGVNTTEATWLGWAKANKVKVALAASGLTIAIVCAIKLA
jgi:hypothetical protein